MSVLPPLAVVQFSTGAASALALHAAVQRFGPARVVALFADVLVEDRDNYRFGVEVTAALGVEYVIVSDGRTPWDVADDEGFIPNNRVPLCSRVLKHEPARRWMNEHGTGALVVVGIGWDEADRRMPGLIRGWSPFEVWAPLADRPLDRDQTVQAVRDELGIEPPRMYQAKFAHANCAGACFRAGQASWELLHRDSPDVYAANEAREEAFRDRTGKDVAIMGETVRGQKVPLTLRRFRERIEAQPSMFDEYDWGGCGCAVGVEVETPV